MVDLNELIANLFKYDQASIDAGKANEEAKLAASRAWVRYQHPENPHITYDTMGIRDQIRINDDILAADLHSKLRYFPDRIPANAPKAELLKFWETFEHDDKMGRTASQSREALAKHLGIDSLEIVGDGDVLLLRKKVPVGNNVQDVRELAISRNKFTPEGLAEFKEHRVLKDSPIWKEAQQGIPAASTANAQSPKTEVHPEEPSVTPAVENIAPVAENAVATASAKKVEIMSKRLEGVLRQRNTLVKNAEAIWDRLPADTLKHFANDDFNKALLGSVSASALQEKITLLKALEKEQPQVSELISAFEKLAKTNQIESKIRGQIAQHLPEGSNLSAHVDGLYNKVAKEVHAAETASTIANGAHTAGSTPAVKTAAAKGGQAAEGWVAKVFREHPGKSWGAVAAAGAAAAGLVYWATREKNLDKSDTGKSPVATR